MTSCGVRFIVFLLFAGAHAATAAVNSETVGTVRVQILSPTLVRLENRGPEGFEDRTTFHIINRNWPGATYSRSTSGGYILIQTSDFVVQVPTNATSLSGIIITKTDGTQLWSYSSLPADDRAWLPGIAANPWAWSIADTPRMVPASWGYNPAPSGAPNYNSNGWDLNNNAPDMYVFLPKGDARQVRADFLRLTGRPELIPLYGLGFWDSRYYEYTAQTALQQIDNYRTQDIPLDVLAIDTCWRVGCSEGYTINTTDFPDMTSFMNSAHGKNVRVIFNDHPEPVAGGLDPTEVIYRNNGLRSLFQDGLDLWWFDRNWMVTLTPPSGINTEVWGMYAYNWVTADYYPARRPLILANVDGIDSGSLNRAPSYVAHRYTIQWTGDNGSDFASLQTAVQDAVYEGAYAAFPYTAVDLGGHTSDPDTETYVRWIEYGSLSPVCRVHGGLNRTRMPWTFGIPAESVSRNFIKMRYRLLPLFYSLARKAYDTGEPILRRCDFDYPAYQQAAANTQYLLGDSALVAPVLQPLPYTVVPSSWLQATGGGAGLTGQYYSNTNLAGSPVLTRTDSTVNFNWGTGSPDSSVPADNFSARWTGNITIGNQDVVLAVTSDDGARLYIDNNLVIDAWQPQNSYLNETTVTFTKNTTHSIRLEYVEFYDNAVCELQWRPVTVSQSLWIPPGSWIDAWSGNVINGPQTISVNVPLQKMPIYIKPGTLVPLAPEMSYTGQQSWDPITLDVYPSVGKTATASLYEDDTVSPDYATGSYRITQITASANNAGQTVTVTITPAQGAFNGASTNRSWVVRIHKPVEWSSPTPSAATVDGVPAAISAIAQDTNAMPFANSGGSPDGDVATITVPSGPVGNTRTIVVNYSVALTITCPGDIVANTDPGTCSSATVNYTVTSADNNSGVTVTCTTNGLPVPSTGATFPIGTTTVICRAGDISNNTASCSFTVTVNHPPPAISMQPASQTVCSGGVATFSVTASGNGPLSYAWRRRGSGWGGGGWQLNGAGTYGGFFVWNSTSNGQGDPSADGDIDTPCGAGCYRSWGLWAASNNVVEAIRPFNGMLAVGQTFKIDMDNGYENSNQSCGFGLRAGSTTNRFEFYFKGGSNHYFIHDSRGLDQDTGIPFSDQGLHIEFTLTGADTYSVTISPVGADNTFTTTTITGTLTGTAGAPIDRMRLFNYNPGASEKCDLFFNSISFDGKDDNASDPAYNGGWTAGSDGGQSLLANGGNISGANTATLVLPNAQPANAGSYDVAVYNACNSAVLSAVASLTITSATACSTLAITSPPDQSYTTNAAITVSGTASALAGVLGVTVNGTLATSANAFTNWTATISGLAACINTLTAVATDTAGNTVTNISHVIYVAGALDCNGDGLPDLWQIQYFGCTACPQAAPSADPDNDGFTNLQELQGGTDPTDPNSSPFRITAITQQSNDVLLVWTTAGGKTNVVQATGGAGGNYSNNFSPISPMIAIPGNDLASTNYLDVGGATNRPARYYRVKMIGSQTGDDASDPAYGGGWTNGSNGGIGFSPWTLTGSGVLGSGTNGYFIGSSTNNAFGTSPGIDVGGKSWGIYANSGNFTAAYRSFANGPLLVGQSLLINMDNGFIDTGNSDGFVLRNGYATNNPAAYDTGARFQFLYLGGDVSNSYKVVDSGGLQNIGVGFTGTGLRLVFTLNTANTYTLLTIDNLSGATNTVSGTLGGSGSLDSLAVYNNNAGNASTNDCLFNSLQIIGP